MALPIQLPAELRFLSILDGHALSTLKAHAFIYEALVQSTQDVPESAVQKNKCSWFCFASASRADADISTLNECMQICKQCQQMRFHVPLLNRKSALESAYKAHTKCIQSAYKARSVPKAHFASQSTLVWSEKLRFADRKRSSSGVKLLRD
eukprot:1127665-Pelagomonas_calceolata.AAC.1